MHTMDQISILENQVNFVPKVGCPFWTYLSLPSNSTIGPENWCIFSLIFVFFFDILPNISLPILFKNHNENIATWMLFLHYPSHKLILDTEVVLF